MKKIFIIMTAACIMNGCNNKPNTMAMDAKTANKESCKDDCCKTKSKDSSEAAGRASAAPGTPIACKLTSPELRERRATVLESLRKQIIEKKELTNGYAFKFPGNDLVIDELAEFIKTERDCCSFFVFNLSVSGNKKEAWLELTGSEGVKDFINTELEFY